MEGMSALLTALLGLVAVVRNARVYGATKVIKDDLWPTHDLGPEQSDEAKCQIRQPLFYG